MSERLKEDGEATLRIHLRDGEITVKNAKGAVLLEGTAFAGFWNELWAAVTNSQKIDVAYRATTADFK